VCRRDIVAGILQRRPNALAALAHRRIRQPDRHEVVAVIQPYARDIDLDLDDIGIDAVHSGAESLEEHGSE
jgi:hypothetical protein